MFLVFYFFLSTAMAQTIENAPQLKDPLFEPMGQKWNIQAVSEFPAYSFYLGAPSVHGVSYQPNLSPRLGARVLYRDWGTLIAFPLPIPRSELNRRGSSTQTNYVLSNYWRHDALDIYYQKFRGVYVSSPGTELQFRKPGRYPQLPDTRITNSGLNWYHALEPDQYSLRAAFNQTEFQLKSGGSRLVMVFYNHLEMNLGSNFVAGSDPNGLATLPILDAVRFDSLGAGGGYGYNFVRKRFFASAQGVLSPALQLQHIQQSEKDSTQVLSVALKGNLNASAGWNYSDYVMGLKFLLDSLYCRVDDTEVWSSLISGQIFVGHRF